MRRSLGNVCKRKTTTRRVEGSRGAGGSTRPQEDSAHFLGEGCVLLVPKACRGSNPPARARIRLRSGFRWKGVALRGAEHGLPGSACEQSGRAARRLLQAKYLHSLKNVSGKFSPNPLWLTLFFSCTSVKHPLILKWGSWECPHMPFPQPLTRKRNLEFKIKLISTIRKAWGQDAGLESHL